MPDSPRRDNTTFRAAVFDRVPAMLAYWSRDQRCRFANAAYTRWFGVGPDELLGRTLESLLGPRLYAENLPHILAALAGREQRFERTILSFDGVTRQTMAHYVPDIDGGEVLGFVVHVAEITHLKQVESALRASEAFLERTGRLAGVGGWEVDLRTGKVVWSPRTRRIHEVDDDYQPTLEQALAFFTPDARRVMRDAVARGTADGTPWDLELPFVTAGGREIWVRALGEVEYEAGVPVRLIGAFQDVTEQRRSREELQREHALRIELQRHSDALDRLVREREEMIDVLAHEVRQPLNSAAAALHGAAGALVKYGEGIGARPLIQAQRVVGEVLASLDNTLAVASLLARHGPVHRADADIDALLAVTIGDIASADRPRLRIERICRTRTVAVDESLIRLALRNLLSNALRYSPAGSPVTIRVSDCDAPLALVIDVVDEGGGIAAERVASLFERHLGAAGASAGHGMGLGLYIVRRVMEMHGGRVHMVSNGPQGVTMRLVIEQSFAD